MANRTVRDAKHVRGTDPQNLIPSIIKSRIYDCKYWKEECFALNAELLVDKAMELRYVGGVFGANTKPTPFLALLLKMLQIQPEKDIIVEFIKNDDFKYARALGALYIRLTGTALECYRYLEPLLNDHRKLKKQNKEGRFEVIHMDEFIDDLLREEKCCDIILPRIQKRHVLEENNELEPRISALDDEDSESSEDEEIVAPVTKRRREDDYKRNGDREKRQSRNDKDKDRSRSRRSRDRRSRDRRDRYRPCENRRYRDRSA